MEVRIGEIQPQAPDPWVTPEYKKMESQVILPVPKNEGSVARKIGEENDATPENSADASLSPKALKELAKEVQSFLEELNVRLSFCFDDETGDLVTRVLNKETGEVIRQMPSKDMIKLRQKLKELRGVLFDAKV